MKLTDPLQAYFRMNTYAGGQFERNAITIDADDGDSLLAELQTPIVDSDSDATHYPHTPLIEHGHHDESMHSIPHKQSSPNENNSQTTIAEDVDFKEEKK